MSLKSVSNARGGISKPDRGKLTTGLVTDEKGNAVPGASIEIISPPKPVADMARLCDRYGRFTILLPEGKFEIEVSARDGRRGKAVVQSGSETEYRIILQDE